MLYETVEPLVDIVPLVEPPFLSKTISPVVPVKSNIHGDVPESITCNAA